MPAVGAESGESRCQGDMEKADMVDGKEATLGFSWLVQRKCSTFSSVKVYHVVNSWKW